MAVDRITTSTVTDLVFDEGVGLCLVAPDGTVVRCNSEWLRSTGYTLDEVIGENVIELFPDTRDMALAMHARARAGHRVEVPRHRHVANGRETWWEGRIAPVTMDGGAGLLITAREVSAEDARAAASPEVRRLRTELDRALDLLEHGDGFYVLDSEFRYVLVNAAQEASSGKTRDQTLGRVIWDVWPQAADRELKFWDVYHRVMRSRRAEVFEEYFAPLDLWAEVRVFPTAEGGIAAFFRRINDRKRAEQALAAEKEKYRSLFEHSLDAVYLTLADGTILDANPAACHLHGMSVHEIRQAGRAGLVVNDDRHAAAIRERAQTGRVWAEMTVRRKDGTTVPVEVQSVLLDPARPGDSEAFVISRDIGKRKRAEELLRKREEDARAKSAELEAILNCIADGVIVYDREGRTVRSNPAADDILRIPACERAVPVQDRAAANYEILSEDGRRVGPDELIAVRAAVRGEVLKRAINRVTSRGNEPRWLMLSATPLLVAGRHTGAVLSMTDITERKAVEEALRESEEKLRLAKDAANMGAWDWNLLTGELVWTDRCKALFGLAPDAAVSHEAFLRAIHCDDAARIDEKLRDALASGKDYEAEMRVPWPDGSMRWVSARGRALFDGRGRAVRMVGMALDITGQKRAEEELSAANEHLRDADRRKDDFLATLSHELRNPLAPIRNSTYILQHAAPGSEEARRAQGVIARQTEHLTRLVDDLLDVTRIARGKIELRRARVDLRELVSRAAEDVRWMMRDRGVRFEVAVPDHPLWADADATRVTQVVGNLLHNAAKFTRGGDTVALSMQVSDGAAEIRVSDTGAGIEVELLPRVFEAFVQGKRTLARTDGGLGLGLALVKGLVELHGGTVRADSAGKGKGSEFLVRLPLWASRERGSASPPRSVSQNGGRRVLVVDDNTDAAESLADIVRLLGHSVEVAFDGASAIEAAMATRPDMVLCDIGLPGMDGYEVAKALRAAAIDGMQIVAVTGYAQPEDVRKAVEAGFDAHVAKPADPAQIERLFG